MHGPLGKTKYNAIRVEFQARGSPHIFIWILNAPKLKIESKEEYTQWIDSIIRADMLKPATLLKSTLLHGCFSRFLNCTNSTKSRNAPYMKNLSSKTIKNIKTISYFPHRGAGVGSSHLTKTIYMSISKALMYKGGHPEKPRILLLTSPGVAAINIDGTTIHTALGITVVHLMIASEEHCEISLQKINLF